MTYVKINETMYPATVAGRVVDSEWDNRESKAITLEVDSETAKALFVDNLAWSIVQQEEIAVYDENDEPTGTEIRETEWDNSEFAIAGDLIDHRDGTVTAKMGKPTDSELLAIIMGG